MCKTSYGEAAGDLEKVILRSPEWRIMVYGKDICSHVENTKWEVKDVTDNDNNESIREESSK